MRSTVVPKIFLSVSLLSILIFLFISENIDFLLLQKYTNKQNINIDDSKLKYILIYTSPYTTPFVDLGSGREGFIRRNCPYTNCYVTANQSYLGNITNFDVVLFAGPEIMHKPNHYFLINRTWRQKYVFASIESSGNYPVCSNRFDRFFNWSWTYRLNSEVRWGYIDIRDSNGSLIGPNEIMHWMEVKDMDPVSDMFKDKLKSKTKAAAWFVSNCNDQSGRLLYAKKLHTALKKRGRNLHIFGDCGTETCPREEQDKCMEMVEQDFYFYLAFENSFSEDYVTEKLLQALKMDVIPVVFGWGNYTR